MSYSRSFVILFLLSSVILLAYGRSHKFKKGEQDFDFLMFTQHWPETACSLWKEKGASHKCLFPRHEEWTIHGIWPDKKHAIGPLFCNKTQRFDPSTLTPILNQLDEKWINIEAGTPHYSLWKHEWEKHGTCASVLTDLNTELKYFQKGLDLLNQYDMIHVLAKANILPGQNYAAQQILDGVKKILGKNILLECAIHPKTKESLIFEIRICLDKSFQLIDCDEAVGFPTNCNRRLPVNYPGTTPGKYSVVLL